MFINLKRNWVKGQNTKGAPIYILQILQTKKKTKKD